MENVKKADRNAQIRILENIYYLSGYIIETAFSYVFFSHIGWIKNEDIEKSAHFQNNSFKTHNLNMKLDYMKKSGMKFSGMEIIDKTPKPNHNKMFNKWCHDIRYQGARTLLNIKLDIDSMNEYIEVIGKLQDQLLKRYL